MSERLLHTLSTASILLSSLSFLCLCGCASTSTSPSSPTPPSASPLAVGILPLTQVTGAGTSGYFEDPLPIHLVAAAGSYAPDISGTTSQVLSCTTLASSCYKPSSLVIMTGMALTNQLPPNTALKGYQNNNIYQDNMGQWQMATTVTVNNPQVNPNGLPWNVILHASPMTNSATTASGVPLSWVSDALLIGSFTARADANYDGKFIEDGNQLYLIYSRNLQTIPTTQDAIVAQPMKSASQLGMGGPTTLLAPENNSDGGFNSELFNCQSPRDQFKLIETGNIAIVNGKYAMAYSSGSYETPCYKVGIAWSDTLLGSYKKILMPDPQNVWANPAPEAEVLYLIQALQPQWPNYVASTVQGPGVPSLVQYPAGVWNLYFAGYDPTVPLMGGMFNPKLRQPYAMRLNINIPAGTTVAATANTDLSGWITAATQ